MSCGSVDRAGHPDSERRETACGDCNPRAGSRRALIGTVSVAGLAKNFLAGRGRRQPQTFFAEGPSRPQGQILPAGISVFLASTVERSEHTFSSLSPRPILNRCRTPPH